MTRPLTGVLYRRQNISPPQFEHLSGMSAFSALTWDGVRCSYLLSLLPAQSTLPRLQLGCVHRIGRRRLREILQLALNLAVKFCLGHWNLSPSGVSES